MFDETEADDKAFDASSCQAQSDGRRTFLKLSGAAAASVLAVGGATAS